MAELGNIEVTLAPGVAEALGPLAEICKQFKDCAIRVLNLRPGDVVVIEHPGRVSDAAFERMMGYAAKVWPNNKAAILDGDSRLAGITREGPDLAPVVAAAIDVAKHHRGPGGIIIPGAEEKRIETLTQVLFDAGYEWESLT